MARQYIQILKDFRVWFKMNESERRTVRELTSDIKLEQYVLMFIKKYL